MSQVKGHIRNRKGKMERVNPYTKMVVAYHVLSNSEKVSRVIAKALNELLKWIKGKKAKTGILSDEQKKYVHKKLKEIKSDMEKNRKVKLSNAVHEQLAEIAKELKRKERNIKRDTSFGITPSKPIKKKATDRTWRGKSGLSPTSLDLRLKKRGFSKQQLAKLSNTEKEAVYWNNTGPDEI